MEDSIIEKKSLNKKLLVRHVVYLFLLVCFLVLDAWFNSRKAAKDYLSLTFFNYIFNFLYYLFCILKKDTKKYTGKFLYNFLNFCLNLSFSVFINNIIYIIIRNQIFFKTQTNRTKENEKSTNRLFENSLEIIFSLVVIVMNYIEVVLSKKEDKSNLSTERHFVILFLIYLPLLIINVLFNNNSSFTTNHYLIIILVDIIGICLGQCIYQCLTRTKKKSWSDENSDDGDNLTELEDKK